jgi:hypothetical protein
MQTNEPEKLCSTRTEKAKRFWELKGSWVMVAGIGICGFMAGSGFQAGVHSHDMQVQRVAHDREIDGRNARLREVNDELKQCLGKQPSTAPVEETKELSKSLKENTNQVKELTNKLEKGKVNAQD